MKFENSQQLIEFNLNPLWLNTAMIKVSGGIDSALVFYMLCKSLEKYPEINIVPQTTNDWKKPYQVNFSKKVVEWMRNEFPNLKILEHETLQLNHGDDYIEGQSAHRKSIFDKYYKKGMPIQLILSGVNRKPPEDVLSTFVNKKGDIQSGPTDDRVSQKPQWKMVDVSADTQLRIFDPIINIDKKGIAELCKNLNLIDTLYPITRSCENTDAEITNNFTTHCGECWWCHERKWGFGKLL